MSELFDLARLCYVEGSWAYFTTQSLDKQWGDDWNDAPYEHNAGEPYGWRPTRSIRTQNGWTAVPNGEPRWEIMKVAWEANDCETPADLNPPNSCYSVEDINALKVPWLTDPGYGTRPRVYTPAVWAGATLREFTEIIEGRSGTVYLPKWFEGQLFNIADAARDQLALLRLAGLPTSDRLADALARLDGETR